MNSRREQSFLSRSDRRLNWARRQLGVPADATPEQVQAKFLAVVEEDDFVPDESLSTAYRILRTGTGGLLEQREPKEFLLAEEETLTEEVEQFAQQMFELPMAERRRRWTELHSRSHLALRPRGRLEVLSPALKADLSAIDQNDALSVKLAGHLCELHPLLPVARAARRGQVLDQLKNDQMISSRAVRRFQSRYADVAALDPDLLAQLVGHPAHEKQIAKATRRRRRETPVVAKSRSSGGSNWWLIGVALMVMSAVGRLITLDSQNPTRPPPTNLYSHQHDEKIRRIIEDIERQRTDTDTQRMLEAIRDLRELPKSDVEWPAQPKLPAVEPSTGQPSSQIEGATETQRSGVQNSILPGLP